MPSSGLRLGELSLTERLRRPELGSIVGILTAAWGALVASFPLDDNSFLTHLATGRLILDRRAVPTTDPFSFTALGTDWTVQSWLPATFYAAAEQIGGVVGLRGIALAVFVTASALVWRLSSDAVSLIPRVAFVSVAIFVVTPLWSMRPLMVGVIGLAVVMLALRGGFSPVWLLPAMWIWVNSHGSFPFAVGLVLLVLAGQALDHQPTATTRRVLLFVAVGCLLGAIGPLRFDALTFSLAAFERADVFAEVIEWKAPSFRSVADRSFLVMIAASIAALVRTRRWTDALPAIAFICASLVAQRNIVMAVLVLLPVLCRAFGTVGDLRCETRPRAGVAVAGLLFLVAGLASATALSRPAATVGVYPGHALAWVDQQPSPPRRLAAEVATGNLLEALDGTAAAVFVDDRFDMFPDDVLQDALTLTRGRVEWHQVLDRRDVDVVVWKREAALASLLAAHRDWQVEYSDARWIVARRR